MDNDITEIVRGLGRRMEIGKQNQTTALRFQTSQTSLQGVPIDRSHLSDAS